MKERPDDPGATAARQALEPVTALASPFARRAIILLWHCTGVVVSLWSAYLLRFDFAIPARFHHMMVSTLPLALVSYLAAYYHYGLFSGLWAYFGMNDLLRTAKAVFWGTGLFHGMVYVSLNFSFADKPRSIFPMMFVLVLLWEAGGRGVSRHWIMCSRKPTSSPGAPTTLLMAPVNEADLILRNAAAIESETGRIVGILTNEKDKVGLTLQGLPILGGVSSACTHAGRLGTSHFLILPLQLPLHAQPAREDLRRRAASCNIKTLPSMQDIASGRVEVGAVRRVDIEDLLPREPNSFDRRPVREQIAGKTVMVTGAGGSIGSELCRQIAPLGPARLILFENSEFALYTLHLELTRAFPDLRVEAVAGDVRLPEDCRDALTRHGRVSVIFHAAAYKHVHLMEHNIPAAFHNNVLGTARLADAAVRHGVSDFILISSDKAVRPTSIMGATKRLAERLLMERPRRHRLPGRALRQRDGQQRQRHPLFKRQIAERGPVTVTTPATRRYFMTIPEAVELVLMAGAVGGDRDIMVLEMGEPVKILDLAEKLIELSGYIPYRDIPIVFTGLRPGEKEYEELITDGENVTRTEHEKLWVLNRECAPKAPPVDLQLIQRLMENKDSPELREILGVYIPESPTFHVRPA
ncbi:MAG: nucleoside-diphosphate sugar epimerase/dehydratase [Kiritimatiellia bacterium]